MHHITLHRCCDGTHFPTVLPKSREHQHHLATRIASGPFSKVPIVAVFFQFPATKTPAMIDFLPRLGGNL